MGTEALKADLAKLINSLAKSAPCCMNEQVGDRGWVT
jgi:hypothetical protein